MAREEPPLIDPEAPEMGTRAAYSEVLMSPTKEDGVGRKRKAQDELEEVGTKFLGLVRSLFIFLSRGFNPLLAPALAPRMARGCLCHP